jgi:hypothetical protein
MLKGLLGTEELEIGFIAASTLWELSTEKNSWLISGLSVVVGKFWVRGEFSTLLGLYCFGKNQKYQ